MISAFLKKYYSKNNSKNFTPNNASHLGATNLSVSDKQYISICFFKKFIVNPQKKHYTLKIGVLL